MSTIPLTSQSLNFALWPAESVTAGTRPWGATTPSKANVFSNVSCNRSPFREKAGEGGGGGEGGGEGVSVG